MSLFKTTTTNVSAVFRIASTRSKPRVFSKSLIRHTLSTHSRVCCKISIPLLQNVCRSGHGFRCFSNGAASDLAAGSFSDPTRPDLYYHLIEPPTPLSSVLPAYALSFLSEAPSGDSSTIIGWLPASTENHAEEEAGLNDFRENPKFRQLLHEAVKSGLEADVDEIQRNGAIQMQQGFMHIHDSRNIPALGRIGDPDDIIASVLVENGKIIAETYQPMPAYRLCTADGITELTEGLSIHLKKVLTERAEMERV